MASASFGTTKKSREVGVCSNCRTTSTWKSKWRNMNSHCMGRTTFDRMGKPKIRTWPFDVDLFASPWNFHIRQKVRESISPPKGVRVRRSRALSTVGSHAVRLQDEPQSWTLIPSFRDEGHTLCPVKALHKYVSRTRPHDQDALWIHPRPKFLLTRIASHIYCIYFFRKRIASCHQGNTKAVVLNFFDVVAQIFTIDYFCGPKFGKIAWFFGVFMLNYFTQFCILWNHLVAHFETTRGQNLGHGRPVENNCFRDILKVRLK